MRARLETRGVWSRTRRCVSSPLPYLYWLLNLSSSSSFSSLQAAPFKAIMKGAQHDKKISRVRVKDSLVEPFVPHYQVTRRLLSLALGYSCDF